MRHLARDLELFGRKFEIRDDQNIPESTRVNKVTVILALESFTKRPSWQVEFVELLHSESRVELDLHLIETSPNSAALVERIQKIAENSPLRKIFIHPREANENALRKSLDQIRQSADQTSNVHQDSSSVGSESSAQLLFSTLNKGTCHLGP